MVEYRREPVSVSDDVGGGVLTGCIPAQDKVDDQDDNDQGSKFHEPVLAARLLLCISSDHPVRAIVVNCYLHTLSQQT